MAQQHGVRGQQWLENAFMRIRQEFTDRIVIKHWVEQDNDPYCRVYFQIAGQDAIDSLAFTRGTLKTCSIPHRTHDLVRHRVESSIRYRLVALLNHGSSEPL